MWIIALDGSKGAGKSTLVETFLKESPDTLELSLDKERRALGIVGTSFEKNKITFKTIEAKLTDAMGERRNVILDCGLYQERIDFLESISAKCNADLHLVFLTAPYEDLINRVKARDKRNERPFNQERFDEVYRVVTDKDYSMFTILDSSKYSPKELSQKLVDILKT